MPIGSQSEQIWLKRCISMITLKHLHEEQWPKSTVSAVN